jgi:hypothetical protein
MPNNAVNYGFTGLTHLFAERVTTVGVQVAQEAITESVAEYNRQMNAMLRILATPITAHQIRYKLPGSTELQPLDEWGNPLPVRPAGHYDVAFPIQRGGYAWGTNRESRALMTLEEVNEFTSDAISADVRWLRRHMLAALLDNTSWVYGDDQYGNLTVQPLANNDTVTYVRRGGTSSADDHYLAQAAAIDATHDPYPTIYDELNEHPSNGGPFVVYISTSLKATTEALSAFEKIADPELVKGTANDYLALDTEFSDAVRGFGDYILGRYERMWIVEMTALPAGYMLAVAQGADSVLRMRQWPAAELQGFFPEFDIQDANRNLNKLLRIAGFGVQNRVGAVAYQVGNASYQIPTGYETPLAS